MPAPVALQTHHHGTCEYRGFDRIQRSEHPRDRARPRIPLVGQQARMAVRDMQYDRPGFEEDEFALFVGRERDPGRDRAILRRRS